MKPILLLLSFIALGCCKENISPEKKMTINKIFFFGDSHTDAGKYGKYTAAVLGCDYAQCARSGSQAKHYINDDSINKMVQFNPDVIVIRLGTNDVMLNKDLNIAFENYDRLVNLIQSRTSAKIVFVNITNISNAGPELMLKIYLFNKFLRNKGNCIDLFYFADYDYIYPDKIHFFPYGYYQQSKITSKAINLL